MNTAFDQLVQRVKKARELSDQWLPAHREAYYWEIPERYYQMSGGDHRQVNNRQRAYYGHIFDPVGMQSLEDGASQIAEAIHPFDQEWIRWRPRDDTPEDARQQVQERCDQYTKAVHSLLTRSNFDVEAPKAHKDFLIGTGFLHIDFDPQAEGRIRCTAMPAYLWAIEEASNGQIWGKYRVEKPRARELPFRFPMIDVERYSADTRKAISEEPDKEICITTAYVWEPRARVWELIVYEDEAKHPVWEAEYRRCPVICYRHGAVAGQVWGAGPGLKALPDVKTANKVKELILKNAAISTTGIWQAEDDGVLNPANIKLTPGSIIPKAAGSAGLTPLEAPGRFDVSQLVLEELHVQIRRAFYVTRVEEREMTAEEYRGRVGQQLREMRGAYGQIRSEFTEPVALRVLDLAAQMGIVELSEADEDLAEIQLTGPLAQNVRASVVERETEVFGTLAQMYGPEMAVAMSKPEKLGPRFVSELGGDPDNWKDEAELIELGQQIQQMVVQLLAQQQAGMEPGGEPQQ